ncbi:versatile peroxidase VPS1 [Abortiporus biennis]|nr:versatile peroxidase VPS1 [Abortiporus biennis]
MRFTNKSNATSLLFFSVFSVSSSLVSAAPNPLPSLDVGLTFKRPCMADPKGRSASNPVCCKWYEVLDDIQLNLFEHECGPEAHESLRLTFHDAMGYSTTNPLMGGGADGSVMHFAEIEMGYVANHGVDEIVELQRPFAIKHEVSFADFIQFAGAVGLTHCPGSPRLQFFTGRSNQTIFPAPDGTLPLASDSVDKILERVNDVGFTADELVDLMASHSVAVQRHVDPSLPVNQSFLDSTPGTFDSQFYLETMLKGESFAGNGSRSEATSPFIGEFRLASDAALARDPRTACEWQSFVDNRTSMNQKFKLAMKKLSLIGHSLEHLVDCSEVIPIPVQPPSNSTTSLGNSASYPKGKGRSDVEVACDNGKGFPDL